MACGCQCLGDPQLCFVLWVALWGFHAWPLEVSPPPCICLLHLDAVEFEDCSCNRCSIDCSKQRGSLGSGGFFSMAAKVLTECSPVGVNLAYKAGQYLDHPSLQLCCGFLLKVAYRFREDLWQSQMLSGML